LNVLCTVYKKKWPKIWVNCLFVTTGSFKVPFYISHLPLPFTPMQQAMCGCSV
jgi:hypothetical protein